MFQNNFDFDGENDFKHHRHRAGSDELLPMPKSITFYDSSTFRVEVINIYDFGQFLSSEVDVERIWRVFDPNMHGSVDIHQFANILYATIALFLSKDNRSRPPKDKDLKPCVKKFLNSIRPLVDPHYQSEIRLDDFQSLGQNLVDIRQGKKKSNSQFYREYEPYSINADDETRIYIDTNKSKNMNHSIQNSNEKLYSNQTSEVQQPNSAAISPISDEKDSSSTYTGSEDDFDLDDDTFPFTTTTTTISSNSRENSNSSTYSNIPTSQGIGDMIVE